jgi:VCBS repeat-containing protein
MGRIFQLAATLVSGETFQVLAAVSLPHKPKHTQIMKKFLTLIAIVSLSAGSAFAACGKTTTSEGTLKSYDAEKKTLVVEAKDGKATTITLTPSTTGADTIATLIGKSVKVVAEHGKAQSVAAGS